MYRQESVMFIYKYKRFSFGFFFLVKMLLVKGEEMEGVVSSNTRVGP